MFSGLGAMGFGFLLMIICILAHSGTAFAEVVFYLGIVAALDVGAPATIIFTIFKKIKCKTIYNLKKQLENKEESLV